MKPKVLLTEEQLVERFKFLKLDKEDKSSRPYPMFGVECGKGWYNILWKMFEGIEKVLKDDESIYVAQIKEKWGLLRIYIDGGNDKIDKLIERAEKKSEKVCEHCGKKGKLRKLNGWLSTLCIKCLNDWKKEQKERLK